MLHKIIAGLIVCITIAFAGIGIVLAQDTTTSSGDLILKVDPNSVDLVPGQVIDFNLHAYYSTGTDQPVNRDQAQWTALSAAGQITNPGVFQASSNVGDYDKAIRASFNGQAAYVRVRIKSPDNTSTNASTTIEPTATPTTQSVSVTAQTATNPTSTPTPGTTNQTTTATGSFILKIDPKQADIYPGQRLSFNLRAYYDSGANHPVSASEATWNIKPPAGTFLEQGIFKASNTVGVYDNAIQASFNGQTVYATLRIKPPDTSSTSATNTPTPISEITTTTVDKSGSSPTNTPSPTPTPISTQAQIEIKNTFILDCLKSRLQPQEYFRHFDPSGPRESLDKLSAESRDRAQRCFQETKPTPTPSVTDASIPSDIASPIVIDYDDAANDPLADQCLQLQLNTEQLQQIRLGRHNLTPAQLKLARSCYQLAESSNDKPLQIRTDATRTSCLKQSLGDQRYQQIYLLHQSPTDADKQAVSQCFITSQNQTDQTTIKAILPADPAEVPFIPTDEQLNFKPISSSSTSNSDQQGTDDALVLSGTALPNSVVDLYIFSDPIVVTTETDANGNWYYQLAYHLPEGDHHAYTVVNHPEKGQVRSEVIGFNVAYAQADNGNSSQLLVSQSTLSQPEFRWYLWSSLSLIIFAVGLTLVFFWYRTGAEAVIHTETITAESPSAPAPDMPPPPTPKA